MGNGGEDVCAVGSGAFNAVSVIDTAFSRLVVNVEILEIVVKVNRACAEVASKKGRVCSKDGGHIDVAFAAERDGEACLPFVKVGNDGCGELARDIFAEEPRDEVAKHDSLVRLVVVGWARDASEIPQVALPFVKAVVLAAGIEQQDSGCALDQPSSVQRLDALGAHALEGGDHVRVRRFLLLNLHRRRLVRQWTDETVPVAVFADRDGDFCFDDCVDATNLFPMSVSL